MEITRNGRKVSLTLSAQSKSIVIPAQAEGRFFIDIDGVVSELTDRGRAIPFTRADDTITIGYGWSAK